MIQILENLYSPAAFKPHSRKATRTTAAQRPQPARDALRQNKSHAFVQTLARFKRWWVCGHRPCTGVEKVGRVHSMELRENRRNPAAFEHTSTRPRPQQYGDRATAANSRRRATTQAPRVSGRSPSFVECAGLCGNRLCTQVSQQSVMQAAGTPSRNRADEQTNGHFAVQDTQ